MALRKCSWFALIAACPVTLTMGILAFAYYCYVWRLCLPLIEQGFAVWGIAYLTMWHVLLLVHQVSYWRTVFRDPGSIPDHYILEMEEIEEGIERALQVEKSKKGQIRRCHKCKLPKPDRAHHCSACGRCVLKMDHHCPWVGNCVGWANHKFFILFLLYSSLLGIYGAITILPVAITQWDFRHLGVSEYLVGSTFVLGVVIGFGIGAFAGVHINFAVHNLTKIESLEKNYVRVMSAVGKDEELGGPLGKKANPFDVGNYRNFIQVFGANPLYWFLPVFTSLGDGCHFQTAMYVELDTVTFGGPTPDHAASGGSGATVAGAGSVNNTAQPAFVIHHDDEDDDAQRRSFDDDADSDQSHEDDHHYQLQQINSSGGSRSLDELPSLELL